MLNATWCRHLLFTALVSIMLVPSLVIEFCHLSPELVSHERSQGTSERHENGGRAQDVTPVLVASCQAANSAYLNLKSLFLFSLEVGIVLFLNSYDTSEHV